MAIAGPEADTSAGAKALVRTSAAPAPRPSVKSRRSRRPEHGALEREPRFRRIDDIMQHAIMGSPASWGRLRFAVRVTLAARQRAFGRSPARRLPGLEKSPRRR